MSSLAQVMPHNEVELIPCCQVTESETFRYKDNIYTTSKIPMQIKIQYPSAVYQRGVVVKQKTFTGSIGRGQWSGEYNTGSELMFRLIRTPQKELADIVLKRETAQELAEKIAYLKQQYVSKT